MNKDNNQRFRDTEERIIAAYGGLAVRKDLDKITVSDICREANIHRTTFYGHFMDIRDLRECASRKQFQRLIESAGHQDGRNYREMILEELRFFYRHKKIIKKSFESASVSALAFFPSVEETKGAFSGSAREEVPGGSRSDRREGNSVSGNTWEYFETFVQAGFMAILRKWILADCPESPEELTEVVCGLYHFEG